MYSLRSRVRCIDGRRVLPEAHGEAAIARRVALVALVAVRHALRVGHRIAGRQRVVHARAIADLYGDLAVGASGPP